MSGFCTIMIAILTFIIVVLIFHSAKNDKLPAIDMAPLKYTECLTICGHHSILFTETEFYGKCVCSKELK